MDKTQGQVDDMRMKGRRMRTLSISLVAILGIAALGVAPVALGADSQWKASWVHWAHDDDVRRSTGKVGSGTGCRSDRVVILKRMQRGHNRVIGRTMTNQHGNWVIRHQALNGKYYAMTPKKVYENNDGSRLVCQWDRGSSARY